MNNIDKVVKDLEKELKNLSKYIYDNPELGYEEYKSSKAHIDILKKHGFDVEENYLDIDTAFKATYDSGKEGATISYLAEYDALPGIGHGCGHNILGTTSTGAGITLSKIIDDIGGKVVVFGTPAEETSGAKVIMAEKGSFEDIDVAMIAHPGDKYEKSGKSLAMEAIQFKYTGRTAHAAASPHEGVNALDAAINTFNNINALREHILPSARIHGIIKEGGEAANIVPDLAIAQFYVRATTKTYLIELVEKVKNCAKGASLAAGTKIEISNYEASYDNMVTNNVLSNLYTKNLKDTGVEEIYEPRESFGSIDAGNVSQVCPAIHPTFDITGREVPGHTREFRDATLTDYAHENMKKTIKALATTGKEIIENKEILEKIKEEFNNTNK
ncbi:M20 family metallopeptidase [Senegalia massiliensis]|uniref:M20 family metallopeptidase n=1 Tax=Senegalia massiliensis TaxID=1720316 RepID=UPI00102F632F|nr:M20 family metallopeptidase [Senegalia massiliensis]